MDEHPTRSCSSCTVQGPFFRSDTSVAATQGKQCLNSVLQILRLVLRFKLVPAVGNERLSVNVAPVTPGFEPSQSPL